MKVKLFKVKVKVRYLL